MAKPVTGDDVGPGDFGYRTRPGTSGLDPFETNLEFGRFQGVMLASALEAMRRSRSPFAMVLWLVIGGLMIAFGLSFVATGQFAIGPFLVLAGGLVVITQVAKAGRALRVRLRRR